MRINFTPWAMHAQYYGGVAQGIYKAEGIDLEIRPPSAGQQNEIFIARAASSSASPMRTASFGHAPAVCLWSP